MLTDKTQLAVAGLAAYHGGQSRGFTFPGSCVYTRNSVLVSAFIGLDPGPLAQLTVERDCLRPHSIESDTLLTIGNGTLYNSTADRYMLGRVGGPIICPGSRVRRTLAAALTL